MATIELRLVSNQEIPLRSDAARVGVQKGKIVEQDVPADSPELAFTVSFELRGDPNSDSVPDFAGPFVHGPRGERFLYLSWGARNSTSGEWNLVARTKIRLSILTWEILAQAQSDPNRVLQIILSLADTKGKRRTGSLSPDECVVGFVARS